MKKRPSMMHTSRPVPDKPRVLFYSHDGLGLGHFRITLAVAEGLYRHVPSAARLLLTGLPSVGAFDLAETLDFVRMPGLDKRGLFEPDFSDKRGALPDFLALRKAIIAATVEEFVPHMVVVDHNPTGLAGELLPVLHRSHGDHRRPIFVLGLRDITYGPERTREEWEGNGSYALLEHAYDLILVYGSPHFFDPILEYGLSPAVAAKTVFTGYFRRPEPLRSVAQIRRELGAFEAPLVVVSAGSGADGAPLIRTFLEAMQTGLLPGIVAYVVSGPQMPRSDWERLTELARPLPGVTFVGFSSSLESHVAAADAVVSMGGYNSIWEAVGAAKRPIVVPRQGGTDEQSLRAERLATLGLATIVRLEDLTSKNLSEAVMAELGRGVSPATTLDFDGLDRVGEALARMLGR